MQILEKKRAARSVWSGPLYWLANAFLRLFTMVMAPIVRGIAGNDQTADDDADCFGAVEGAGLAFSARVNGCPDDKEDAR